MTACVTMVVFCGYAYSEEIAPFRVTGIEGEVYARYFTDHHKNMSDGEINSRRDGKTFEKGLDLTVHSYLYHPNFIRLDFGGGPVHFQHIYDTESDHISGDDHYTNIHAKANILERKPFPLMLYYEKEYNTTPYAVQDRMLVRREDYGLNFRLKRPLSPFLVDFDLVRTSSNGQNQQRITDETTDRAILRLSGDLGPNGKGRMSHKWAKYLSKSGSLSLDVDEKLKYTQFTDIWTEHLFGNDKQIRLTNSLMYRDQDNLPDYHEIQYNPRLNIRHSKALTSFYRYSYLGRTNYFETPDPLVSSDNSSEVTHHSISGGLTHLSFDDRLQTGLNLLADKYDTEGLEQTYYQGDVNLSYLQDLNIFKVRYSGSLGYDYTERVGDQVSVFAEFHNPGIQDDTFELRSTYVNEDSVVVKDEKGIIYDEGLDYVLITIGDTTSVDWIGDFPVDDFGNPLTLLVDYDYQSGGEADFSSLRQRYGIDLTRGNYLRLYAKYYNYDRELESGNPTIPLNSEETLTLGLQVDYPLANRWTLGGRAEHEDKNADIGSYRRDSAGIYLQIPRLLKGNLRLFSDKVWVDNRESPEDVDLLRYGVRYHARLWNRTTLSANYVEESDTGGTRDRSNTRAKVRLGWKYRQLSLSAQARYDTYEYGNTENKRSSIDLLLSRRF